MRVKTTDSVILASTMSTMSTMATNITDSKDITFTSVRECVLPAPFKSTELSPFLLAHCYILGTIFNFLAVTAIFFFYRLVQIKARPLVLSINILLVIMAGTRYIYLAIDPYNLRMYFPTWCIQVLEDIAIPCLTSAFAIMQYGLFQLCKFQRPNSRMHIPIVCIIVFHFTIVILIDVLIITKVVGCWLLMFCQVFTLTWGLLLCVSVSIVAFKLVSRDKRVKRTLRGDDRGNAQVENGNQSSSTPNDVRVEDPAQRRQETRDKRVKRTLRDDDQGNAQVENGNQSLSTPNDMRVEDPAQKKKFADHLRKLKRICFAASVTGLFCFVVSLLGTILIATPLVNYQVDWVEWLMYQTAQRLVEIAFGFILLYISWQRSDVVNKKKIYTSTIGSGASVSNSRIPATRR